MAFVVLPPFCYLIAKFITAGVLVARRQFRILLDDDTHPKPDKEERR